MRHLAKKARNVARDIEPENELRNLRIRTKQKEIIVSYEQDFIIIVIQKWTAAE